MRAEASTPGESMTLSDGAVPPRLYHATPLRNWASIQENGLLPGRLSHPHLAAPGIYLTHQLGVALNYAEMAFGSDDPNEPWAIVEIDGGALDPSRLRADDGHETRANFEDIVARGIPEDRVLAGDFPWGVCLEETGQVVYMDAIPPGALSLEREVAREPSAGPSR